MAVQYTGLNGIVKMSFDEYSNMAHHDSNTKYIVYTDDSVEEYLGDVRITNESGGSWVTMATFEAYTETQATVVQSIYNDVESLKTWKDETVDPFIESATQSISDIEDTLAGIDLSDLDGDDPNSWKNTVNDSIAALQTAVTALQAAVSTLQNNAVTSTDIRVISVVSSVPQIPASTTMYIVEESS